MVVTAEEVSLFVTESEASTESSKMTDDKEQNQSVELMSSGHKMINNNDRNVTCSIVQLSKLDLARGLTCSATAASIGTSTGCSSIGTGTPGSVRRLGVVQTQHNPSLFDT